MTAGPKNKKRKPDKSELFVKIMLDVLDAPAWRTVSFGARSLYIALRRGLRNDCSNNGHIFLSQRDAVVELGSKKNRRNLVHWFRELVHYGFIVMMEPGNLGLDGAGRAPHWRLTEASCQDEAPTRDFLKWDGTIFEARKKTKPWYQRGCQGGTNRGAIRHGTNGGATSHHDTSLYGTNGGAISRPSIQSTGQGAAPVAQRHRPLKGGSR
jgi:hypothetical protein